MVTVAFDAARHESDAKYRETYRKFIAHVTPLKKISPEQSALNTRLEAETATKIVAGIKSTPQLRPVQVVLSNGTTAGEVFQKVIREDAIYDDRIVRSILDKGLGIARVGAKGELFVWTPRPERAIGVLLHTHGVSNAFLANTL
ncbi:MAG TPA: hypothetical protein VMV79_01305 [Alphaproteobacteria bacterium]|nr:hypothetical protein [Alphaproteobacteria bacterium]